MKRQAMQLTAILYQGGAAGNNERPTFSEGEATPAQLGLGLELELELGLGLRGYVNSSPKLNPNIEAALFPTLIPAVAVLPTSTLP